jgi:hypothetical protein
MLLPAAAIVSAQPFEITFTSKAPFAVASTTLPAGTYQIRLLDMDEDVFECSSASGSISVMFEADQHQEVPTATEVTFAKYGDKLILKNVSISGVAGYFIPLSVPEKRSKKGAPKAVNVSTAATKH